MDSFLQIFIFSVVMLFGSYIVGSVPLFMPMSESNLHLVSVMGAGLLVGTAFAVIVPEGMQTLIKAYQLKDKAMHGKKNN
jgi:zinc transporter 9